MDEAALIEKLKSGDDKDREWLYHKHQKRLYATAVHFLGWQDPDAEDMVQETFVRALAKMKPQPAPAAK